LRIAVVTSRYPYGGADQVARLLVGAFEPRHEVHFLTTGEKDEVFAEEGHERVVIALPHFRMFWHHYWNPSVVRALRRHLARIRPDVVHFHSIANRTFSAAALLVSRDYPTVWSLHDVWSQCIWSAARPPTCHGMLKGCAWCAAIPVLSIFNRRLKESVFRRADIHVIVPSRWLCERIAGSVLARKPVHVIPNGIRFETFSTRSRDRTRTNLGIPPTDRVVLFAGQMLNNWKGHEDLLRIAVRVLADNDRVWFVFVGPHRRPIPAHPRIVFTGAVPYEAMPDYYAAGDVFAYPTHADIFALVVVEAMASALPVVTHRVGGVSELVEDGVVGFVVEEHDEDSFEEKLRRLLGDSRLSMSMGEAGRERVRRFFTLEEQVRRIEALYEQMVFERTPPRAAPGSEARCP
jgi:glycosyltransferase involved in cell wall biosynthesis